MIIAGVFLHKEEVVTSGRPVSRRLSTRWSCETVSVSWTWWKSALAVQYWGQPFISMPFSEYNCQNLFKCVLIFNDNEMEGCLHLSCRSQSSKRCCYAVHTHPLPSSRQYLSYDACLEVKREVDQNCSMLCCVRQLCTMICTRMWAVLEFFQFSFPLFVFI